ncbi:factor Xa inhibitor BuXI-like [Arachis stenosperma]|uniref:factor Xa inhibitor BuXI-like n=1 Tax=Arachis stenosperma TaxID=217475 RepID=UPI0025ABD008|nr:factor Xa inhibitor BuXI-like [Arachis stenosperma]
MKATSTTNVFAIFILFAFISFHLPSLATAELLDTDGDLIQNGGLYYILPVFRGNGGGIGRTTTGNETCPLTVVQQRSEVDNGLPIKISSLALILYLYEGLPLDLSFSAVPLCTPIPSRWTLVKGLLGGKGATVKLTGFYENEVQGWFEIRKHLDDYKLRFCASSNNNCVDIGVKRDDEGNRLLVATEDNPFVVMFKKAKSSYSA